MRIDKLYGRFAGATVYVVGTGPSLRCFPAEFFADKVTFGLNQCWRHFAPTFSVTVHPELLVEYRDLRRQGPKEWPTKWVVKKKPPLADLPFDDPDCYVFDTSYEADSVYRRPTDTLYLGEGVQTCAIDLAARTGARFVILVGCDGGAVGGDFHAHDQHVRWLGMKPEDQYRLYRDTTAGVRRRLRPLGTHVLTMSPFVSVVNPEEDYARLRNELNLPKLPPPKDTSAYVRDPKTIRTGK